VNQPHNQIVIVTLLSILVYLWTGIRVAGARRKFGIAAPAMTGNMDFERYVRVQMNTLEWLPVFLAVFWMASLYWPQTFIALIGLVWPLGRIIYAIGYTKAAGARGPGFGLQGLAVIVLLIAAAIGAVRQIMVTGGV
jgi:glutathione S-transferase